LISESIAECLQAEGGTAARINRTPQVCTALSDSRITQIQTVALKKIEA